jgi:hypothetical protein
LSHSSSHSLVPFQQILAVTFLHVEVHLPSLPLFSFQLSHSSLKLISQSPHDFRHLSAKSRGHVKQFSQRSMIPFQHVVGRYTFVQIYEQALFPLLSQASHCSHNSVFVFQSQQYGLVLSIIDLQL